MDGVGSPSSPLTTFGEGEEFHLVGFLDSVPVVMPRSAIVVPVWGQRLGAQEGQAVAVHQEAEGH